VRLAQRRRLAILGVLTPPLLWMLVFMLVPYAIMFTYSFWTKKFPTFVPDFQFGNYALLFADPQYYQVLLRTLKIALLVSIAALLLAYPLAYFLAFKVRSPRLRLAIYMATVVPLWVSYLLRAYTWKTILGSEGVINSFLMYAHVIAEPLSGMLYSRNAVIVTLVYVWIPFAALPISAALQRIDRDLLEAAADLGAPPARSFWAVTFPLSLPGVLAAFFMVFIPTVGEYVTPLLIGGSGGSMYGNIIQDFFTKAANWPRGAALSMVMLVVTLLLVAVAARLVNVRRLIG
jgi:spermidine/putrescine transport system permease protein